MTIEITGYIIQIPTTEWIDERVRLGFSQGRIAALLGCTQQCIAKWESGPVFCLNVTQEQYSGLIGAGFGLKNITISQK